MSDQVYEFKTVQDVIEHFKDHKHHQGIIEALKSLPVPTERPARISSGERRGQLAGLTLEGMSDAQLKREKINASSVLYKAKQRNAAQDTIDKNQARVDAVDAALAKRKPAEAPSDSAAPAEGAAEAPAEGAAEGAPAGDTSHPVEGEL